MLQWFNKMHKETSFFFFKRHVHLDDSSQPKVTNARTHSTSCELLLIYREWETRLHKWICCLIWTPNEYQQPNPEYSTFSSSESKVRKKKKIISTQAEKLQYKVSMFPWITKSKSNCDYNLIHFLNGRVVVELL